MDVIWNEWSGFEKLMICIAIPFTLLFIIQVVLTIIGAELSESLDVIDNADIDFAAVDAEGSDSGSSFFTIRNMISFFACLGWTGFLLKGSGYNELISLIAGIFTGLLSMTLNFLLLRFLSRLSENNTFNISKTIGAHGKVYTPIEPGKIGLVQVNYGGGFHELQAKSSETLPSHTPIKVVEVIGQNLVIVKSL